MHLTELALDEMSKAKFSNSCTLFSTSLWTRMFRIVVYFGLCTISYNLVHSKEELDSHKDTKASFINETQKERRKTHVTMTP